MLQSYFVQPYNFTSIELDGRFMEAPVPEVTLSLEVDYYIGQLRIVFKCYLLLRCQL